ncbi:hypothetical protein EJ02DRAFT_443611 [Clathrospora elynae]|uniref:Sensitive to high expression protein 9, mitochondrial n=1 Tax=Clathrospora elynae TaxID=706981 RepID=A0A6A5SQR9_9PLEO|nr:hypothetical protein EJ02DRAFT_443611 [Clathrospora elynae]
MPPPASESQTTQQSKERAPGSSPSREEQDRLQKRLDAILEDQANQKKILEEQANQKKARESSKAEAEKPSVDKVQEPPRKEPTTTSESEVADNIARVPDEYLPSHRERQRWHLSKRFSEVMDELLPKLAVVTQKVNTYTGTDYSGVEALRREIIEQEKLVKARRLAIDSAKQALDTALAHQATSQKEVVALLERKHSWSSSDLERYMALIRSEHINDKAVGEAKEAVANAETALEDARAQLEKRERAQYHEEQIWSDTIRRNSTWVTFGLMGVNIFLLLLSLAILEPWRRKRMVKEIKNALEAQLVAMDAAPASVAAAVPASAKQDLVAIEEAIDRAQHTDAPVQTTTPTVTQAETPAEPNVVPVAIPETAVDSTLDPAVPGAAPLMPEEVSSTPQESINIVEEATSNDDTRGKSWQQNITFVAHDIVSERVISMRRIDYTTAILQGAAAGAVITATLIAMLRSN